MTELQYIDLFAGIGGFHQALKYPEKFKCVYASEIDKDAAEVYFMNHGIMPKGDITKVHEEEIPPHNLLCAGFPCQPFSKGGLRAGFEDTRGTLFFDIVRIVKLHQPRYLLLENVPNIVSHDNGYTYKRIIQTLNELGYVTPESPLILSPHNLGIPVHRPRAFFPCVHKSDPDAHDKTKIKVPKSKLDKNEIKNFFSFTENKDSSLQISDYEESVLNMWNEFYQLLDIKVVGFPIWFDTFNSEDIDDDFPLWKKVIIKKNHELFSRNNEKIVTWMKKYDNLKWVKPSHRKFEWQCGKDCESVFDGLIQFRPSGIRVKRLNYFSTLVAMNHPQIYGPMRRRLSSDETKLLQSFPKEFKVHENRHIALKQFGNSVNVEVIRYILREMGILNEDKVS